MSIEMDQIYSTLAFLHTLAAMGLFAGMAIEAVAVRGLGQAGRPQPAREWIAVYRIALRLSMASMVLLLLAGLVMMAVRWEPAVWILTGIVALILTGLLGGLVSRSRIRAMVGQADSATGQQPRSRIEALPRDARRGLARDEMLGRRRWPSGRTHLGVAVRPTSATPG